MHKRGNVKVHRNTVSLSVFKATEVKRLCVGLIMTTLLIITASQIYEYINVLTGDKAPIIFMQSTMLWKDDLEVTEAVEESVAYYMNQAISPMNFFYGAMPYYKSKTIELGIYEEELAGYFQSPDEEIIVSVEKENPYNPQFEPPEQQQEFDLANLKDPNYLLSKIYSGGEVQADAELFSMWNFEELAQMPIAIDESVEGPKILIFHTHSKERFLGEGEGEEGIIATGEVLHDYFEQEYGIETLHVTESFYPTATSYDTKGAYERMEPVIHDVLKQNPSIQVVIDLHRDGVGNPNTHLVDEVDGKPAAKFMFVNGLCMSRNEQGEIIPMKWLENPYLEENLAFALQAQIAGMEYYPQLMRKIYLKPYRYSLHMVPYSLLIELGAETNTPEEALNAVKPIADIVAKVLEKD